MEARNKSIGAAAKKKIGCESEQEEMDEIKVHVRSNRRKHRDHATRHDCSSGITWSAEKASWCCEHEKRGCPESASETEVDCELEINHWKTKWSDIKKEFCCDNKRKGCPETSSHEGALQLLTDRVKNLPIWHIFR